MTIPNLFSFATSELSQDAFICWLLAWASPEYGSRDKSLHECGVNLVRALFGKHGKEAPPQIEKVEVHVHENNIDILCIINEVYPILIEDKTWTKNHSNQLVRYLEEVKRRPYNETNIIPIYFKTEDQSDYSEVEQKGYKPFLRDDFLDVLNSYNGTNSILVDYRNHLQSISDDVESYKSLPITQWKPRSRSWIGFFLELQRQSGKLGEGRWGYVHNPTGGFFGFWWASQGNDNCEQYLQLEEDKLCFKISVGEKSPDVRRSLRSKWYELVRAKGQEYGLDLVRPRRFGNGKCLTVCVFNGDYRESDNDLIDMEKTVARLRKAECLLKSVDQNA